MTRKLKEVINVASVPFRSPFRYPGGKTWFVPRVRQWIQSLDAKPMTFLEPFVGGGIVGLSVAFEDLAEKIVMVELDDNVAAVWKTILNGNGHWLAKKTLNFDFCVENVNTELSHEPDETRQQAFRTLLRNRINRGGILAEGAGRLKSGEDGKGIASRWYPETLHDRIVDILHIKEHISFIQGDGIQEMRERASDGRTVTFIDPPYTESGRRLYTHSEVDHEQLFETATQMRGHFLMTYNDSELIREKAQRYRLDVAEVPMRDTHNTVKYELVIGDDVNWLFQ